MHITQAPPRTEDRPDAIQGVVLESAIAPLRKLHPARPAPALRIRPVGGPIKRAFDVVGASAALVLLSPLLLALAAAIRLDSPGPIFFLQRRGGFGRRTFLVCKFRTMTTLDDGGAITQAVKHDARLTRIGGFLRRASLDELPQIWNVLRGEMSLVGPRPHALAHDKRFAKLDPDYRLRRRARPGITGLAQISGSRGPIESAEAIRTRTAYDLAYIARWSLWLDLQIIAKTIWIGRRDRGAF